MVTDTSQWLMLTEVCFSFQIELSGFSDPWSPSETQEPKLRAATISDMASCCAPHVKGKGALEGTPVGNELPTSDPDVTHSEGLWKDRSIVDYCWGPAPAESRGSLRMSGVGEETKASRVLVECRIKATLFFYISAYIP